jgi:hypothetical protein
VNILKEKEDGIKTLKERLNSFESQAMKIKDQVDELKHTMNGNLKMIDYGRMLTERMTTEKQLEEYKKEDSKKMTILEEGHNK